MAADHDTSAKTFLEWLHIWLDARKVQPLDINREGGEERIQKQDTVSEVGGRRDWINGGNRSNLGFWVQREKLQSAIVPVDLIQLIRLPRKLETKQRWK